MTKDDVLFGHRLQRRRLGQPQPAEQQQRDDRAVTRGRFLRSLQQQPLLIGIEGARGASRGARSPPAIRAWEARALWGG
jgi:hypothetical protein